jgi:hypothetical protein
MKWHLFVIRLNLNETDHTLITGRDANDRIQLPYTKANLPYNNFFSSLLIMDLLSLLQCVKETEGLEEKFLPNRCCDDFLQSKFSIISTTKTSQELHAYVSFGQFVKEILPPNTNLSRLEIATLATRNSSNVNNFQPDNPTRIITKIHNKSFMQYTVLVHTYSSASLEMQH